MRQFKKVVKLVAKTDFVVCNMCGEKIEQQKYQDNFISVEKKWGYGSAHDGETHCFDLCEKCYDEIAAKFKIKP